METMTTTRPDADRLRRHRARQRAGRVVVSVEVDEVVVSEFLITASLLDATQADDRAALAKAVEKLIVIATKEESK
jgi:hypothetical protein